MDGLSDRRTLVRVHRFLHGLALFLFGGTAVELVAAKHYQETLQLVPLVLIAVSLLALGLTWVRPGRPLVLVTVAILTITMGGSLLGVYEHVMGNLDLIREVRRNPSTRDLIDAAITGRNPPLAPGTLAVSAVIGLAALAVQHALRPAGRITAALHAQGSSVISG